MFHAFYLTADGRIRGFGFEQTLGNDGTIPSGVNVPLVGGDAATGWGANSTRTQVKLPGNTAHEVVTNGFAAFARRGDLVYSWGYNDPPDGFSNAADPSGTFRITGVLGSDTNLKGRGYSSPFLAPSENLAGSAPINFGAGVAGITAMAAGAFHACILYGTFGSVKCWGANDFFQLGFNGGAVNRYGCSTAGAVSGRTDGVTCGTVASGLSVNIAAAYPQMGFASKIAAGAYNTCAAGGNRALCWGNNDVNFLGSDVVNIGGVNFGRFQFPAGVQKIVMSAGHILFLLQNGEVYLLGITGGYQGLGVQFTTPTLLSGLSGVVDVASSPMGIPHNCVVLNTGAVQCWGGAGFGKLGFPSPIQEFSSRNTVDLGSNFGAAVRVFAGQDSTCAINASGQAKCWGYNQSGMLGRGDMSNPGEVPGTMGNALSFLGQ